MRIGEKFPYLLAEEMGNESEVAAAGERERALNDFEWEFEIYVLNRFLVHSDDSDG